MKVMIEVEDISILEYISKAGIKIINPYETISKKDFMNLLSFFSDIEKIKFDDFDGEEESG